MAKIYTKTGDKGKTSLFDGTRIAKNNIRVEAYGTMDELNAVLGIVISELRSKNQEVKLKKELISLQKDLFEMGSLLANPQQQYSPEDIKYWDGKIKHFEELIDDMTDKIPLLANFVLPGGGKVGAYFHLARTVARRAERRIIDLSQNELVEIVFIRYLNRLSDLLFTMSRFANFLDKKKEIIWDANAKH